MSYPFDKRVARDHAEEFAHRGGSMHHRHHGHYGATGEIPTIQISDLPLPLRIAGGIWNAIMIVVCGAMLTAGLVIGGLMMAFVFYVIVSIAL